MRCNLPFLSSPSSLFHSFSPIFSKHVIIAPNYGKIFQNIFTLCPDQIRVINICISWSFLFRFGGFKLFYFTEFIVWYCEIQLWSPHCVEEHQSLFLSFSCVSFLTTDVANVSNDLSFAKCNEPISVLVWFEKRTFPLKPQTLYIGQLKLYYLNQNTISLPHFDSCFSLVHGFQSISFTLSCRIPCQLFFSSYRILFWCPSQHFPFCSKMDVTRGHFAKSNMSNTGRQIIYVHLIYGNKKNCIWVQNGDY